MLLRLKSLSFTLPAIIRRRVDFPVPLGPTTATISDILATKETDLSIVTVSKLGEDIVEDHGLNACIENFWTKLNKQNYDEGARLQGIISDLSAIQRQKVVEYMNKEPYYRIEHYFLGNSYISWLISN
ncbi:hypothetical protein Lal_00016162 [Lupinus albus]|nr:hypothetical protein Lal_00016162 [Lupinus albus]